MNKNVCFDIFSMIICLFLAFQLFIICKKVPHAMDILLAELHRVFLIPIHHPKAHGLRKGNVEHENITD